MGALLSTWILKIFSRKNSIIFLNGVALLGGIIIVSYNAFAILIIGRFVQGVAMGGLSSVVPMVIK